MRGRCEEVEAGNSRKDAFQMPIEFGEKRSYDRETVCVDKIIRAALVGIRKGEKGCVRVRRQECIGTFGNRTAYVFELDLQRGLYVCGLAHGILANHYTTSMRYHIPVFVCYFGRLIEPNWLATASVRGGSNTSKLIKIHRLAASLELFNKKTERAVLAIVPEYKLGGSFNCDIVVYRLNFDPGKLGLGSLERCVLV